jgi:hypothetical protein
MVNPTTNGAAEPVWPKNRNDDKVGIRAEGRPGSTWQNPNGASFPDSGSCRARISRAISTLPSTISRGSGPGEEFNANFFKTAARKRQREQGEIATYVRTVEPLRYRVRQRVALCSTRL